jgi:hypothetical protein
MKIIIQIFSCIVIFTINVVYGQEKQTVALYVSGNDSTGVKKVITAKLIAALASDSDYAVTDRTTAFNNEMRKQQQPFSIDDSGFAKLGRQFESKFVCVAELTEVLGSAFVVARLIDVEIASVVATAEKDAKMKDIRDLERVANEVIAALTKNVFTGDCRKKDQPVSELVGCCEGLENINGICRDVSGVAYWISKSACGLEVAAADKGPSFWANAKNLCPYGWRLPTINELKCLLASDGFKATLKGLSGIWTSTTEVRLGEYKYASFYSVGDKEMHSVEIERYNEPSYKEWLKCHVRCVRK